VTTRTAVLLALWLGSAATLSGCATPRRDEPIADGSVVALSVTKSLVAATTPIVDLTARGAFATGVGTGTVAGLGIGLTCGPFLPFCLAVTLPIGAAAGALTGALVAYTAELPATPAAQVRDRWTRALAARDVLADVTSALNEQARAHWTLASQGSTALVQVELQDFELTSTREQQIGFILRASVSAHAVGGDPRVTPKLEVYELVVPPVPLAQWLDETDAGFDRRLRLASQQFAAQIVMGLTAR
jgi:hypothetical protein